MPDEVDVESPSEKRELGEHDERHCRCYKPKGSLPPLTPVDDIEKPSLQKSTYYSRVTNKYSTQRIVKEGQKPIKKGFRTLRDECLKADKLYEDPEFPPNDYSISFQGITRRHYEWKRPHEFTKDPHMFVEGATRFDIQQGELGDCWLLAAVSNLTQNPRLFHVVVPRDQGFTHMYAGIFHFKFWQYGRWEEVVIDDMLPTYHNQLVFMHSKTDNEFWCALLEKAYAKLYGGYEALRGGNINESMVDLTGGVVEMVDLRNPPSNLFSVMKKAYRRAALMGCAIEPDHPQVQSESILPNGLIVRHAYSITRVTEVDIASAAPKLQEQKLTPSLPMPHLQGALAMMNKSLVGLASVAGVTATQTDQSSLKTALTSLTNWTLSMAFPEGKAELVRLHNPWGNETEWTGAWSDKSPEWATISADEKKRLGLTFDDDGEFWMSIKDFASNFTTLEICDVTPEVFEYDNDSDDDSSSDEDEEGQRKQQQNVQRRWQRLMFEGAWVSHHTAGGCRNFIQTFASNPQYTVKLEDPDEDDDDDLCTMVVSLMQKNVRQLKRYGADYQPIGYTIYKLPPEIEPGVKLDTEFFKYNASYAKVPFFLNCREVTTRFRFPAGYYVIVASTFEPEMTGEFLLRIFTEAKRLKSSAN
ncbi:calpain-B-like isoform X1 [Penaeus monodon]|uniref:calpain-B-like isoform X1 n=1 Tax=Penaeus monodon TaxID=6687 RepID=UPI0018A72448|nr:calpain-B-like isoform X1 [Penaeus monodon]